MPMIRYQIRNEYGLSDPELYGSAEKDDPEALLEGVAMAGLVGVLRQLGDLAEFAAEIFHELHEEVMATASRGHGLMLRLHQIEVEFPSVENSFVSQITQPSGAQNDGIEWHSNIQIDRNLITRGDMPRFIMDSYEECRGPARLFTLDKFDVAGAGACLKRYSDPSFFKTEFASSGLIETEDAPREKKARKIKKKVTRWRKGETLESLLVSSSESQPTTGKNQASARTATARVIRLKSKKLQDSNNSTSRIYREHLLELIESQQKILLEDSRKQLPIKKESNGTTKSIPQMNETESEDILVEITYQQSGEFQKKNKIFPILEQNEILSDPEKLTENGNKSDEIGSQQENLVDALNTIESELGTDSGNKAKPVITEPDATKSNENQGREELDSVGTQKTRELNRETEFGEANDETNDGFFDSDDLMEVSSTSSLHSDRVCRTEGVPLSCETNSVSVPELVPLSSNCEIEIEATDQSPLFSLDETLVDTTAQSHEDLDGSPPCPVNQLEQNHSDLPNNTEELTLNDITEATDNLNVIVHSEDKQISKELWNGEDNLISTKDDDEHIPGIITATNLEDSTELTEHVNVSTQSGDYSELTHSHLEEKLENTNEVSEVEDRTSKETKDLEESFISTKDDENITGGITSSSEEGLAEQLDGSLVDGTDLASRAHYDLLDLDTVDNPNESSQLEERKDTDEIRNIDDSLVSTRKGEIIAGNMISTSLNEVCDSTTNSNDPPIPFLYMDIEEVKEHESSLNQEPKDSLSGAHSPTESGKALSDADNFDEQGEDLANNIEPKKEIDTGEILVPFVIEQQEYLNSPTNEETIYSSVPVGADLDISDKSSENNSENNTGITPACEAQAEDSFDPDLYYDGFYNAEDLDRLEREEDMVWLGDYDVRENDQFTLDLDSLWEPASPPGREFFETKARSELFDIGSLSTSMDRDHELLVSLSNTGTVESLYEKDSSLDTGVPSPSVDQVHELAEQCLELSSDEVSGEREISEALSVEPLYEKGGDFDTGVQSTSVDQVHEPESCEVLDQSKASELDTISPNNVVEKVGNLETGLRCTSVGQYHALLEKKDSDPKSNEVSDESEILPPSTTVPVKSLSEMEDEFADTGFLDSSMDHVNEPSAPEDLESESREISDESKTCQFSDPAPPVKDTETKLEEPCFDMGLTSTSFATSSESKVGEFSDLALSITPPFSLNPDISGIPLQEMEKPPPLPPLGWRLGGKLKKGSSLPSNGLSFEPLIETNPFSDTSNVDKDLGSTESTTNPFAPVQVLQNDTCENDSKRVEEEKTPTQHILNLSELPPIPQIQASQPDDETLTKKVENPNSNSNPFVPNPPLLGENLPNLDINPFLPVSGWGTGQSGYLISLEENLWVQYGVGPSSTEDEKLGRKPYSIKNMPRNPLIDAVTAHDRSTMRKVSELVRLADKPKWDERNSLLEQIRNKSFSLKPVAAPKPTAVKAPTTNLKVAAIVEKANAIRQAFAGSDEEDGDNWSDC